MSETRPPQLARHVLPPGFEERDHVVYGYFYIEVGKIIWLKGASVNTKLKLKFWGERSSGQVLRPVNVSAKELQHIPTTIEYEIRCPMTSFQKYLGDCTHLKFMVLEARSEKPLGNTQINLHFYIKHK